MPLVTRVAIAEKFNIKKKGATHVVNDFVQSDGYEVKDIDEAITLHSMQEFLGTEEEGLSELWEMMVAKIEGRTNVDKPVMNMEEVRGEIESLVADSDIERKNKPGRPRKNAQ